MRHWVILVVAGAFAAGSASALAGGYDVQACNASIAGGANNSFAPAADNGMTAYTDCPAGQGLVARTVWDHGHTGALQAASMIFDAPAGTYVQSIDFMAGWRRADCNYAIGIVGSAQDNSSAILDWGWGAGTVCDNANVADDYAFYPARLSAAINAPRVRIEARCGWVAYCTRDNVTSMRLKDVTVHVRDDTPPALSNGRGALWTSSGWLGGDQSAGFDASDGAGIREASVSVDGRPVAHQTFGCDYTLRAPCPGGSIDQAFATTAFGGDGVHTIELSAVDAGGNAVAVSRTVRIDNTAPDAPQNLVVAGGDGWRAVNGFDVAWTNPSQSGRAPITAALYELCPMPSGPCTKGSAQGSGVSSISGLHVPAPGEYRMRVWLQDAAGNQDIRLAAPAAFLRYDDTSPLVTIEAPQPDDPTLVVVDVTDSGSGLAGGTIALRRREGTKWRTLDTAVDGSRLVAHIDDEHLADGTYVLRASAVDQAGNEKSTEERGDGQPALLILPLRLKTRLRAGVVESHHHHLRLAHKASVRYGRVVRVRGRLTTPEGNPLQGVPVDVYSRLRGQAAPPQLVATVRTSRRGRFSFRVEKGPSRTITLHFAGTREIRSVTRVISLNVRATTTLRANRHRLVNGETVHFSGRVLTRPLPAPGKLIAMQVWVRGRWRTFATTRANRRGRWHYDYRFDGTRGVQLYRFRAQVPEEAAYPFSTGQSHQVRVTVRGV